MFFFRRNAADYQQERDSLLRVLKGLIFLRTYLEYVAVFARLLRCGSR